MFPHWNVALEPSVDTAIHYTHNSGTFVKCLKNCFLTAIVGIWLRIVVPHVACVMKVSMAINTYNKVIVQ